MRGIRHSRFVPAFAIVALVATLPVSIGTLLHAESDDVLCRLTVVEHDESAHRLVAFSPATQRPEHCAVCHWLRSLRTVQYSVPFCAPSSIPHLVVVASDLGPASAICGHRPARAPPLG